MFAFILVKVAKKPLSNLLKAKREEYENQFMAAKKEREEADKRLSELNQRLSNLDTELSEIKAKAKKEAESDAARIVEQGRVLAEHIKDEAKRVAQAELQKAQETLNEQVLKLVHEKVAEKLKNELGKQDHSRVVASQVNTLTSLAARG